MLKKITRTVVIGSGCAGLNAADWLYDLGERDFCLVTENLLSGTSRNTGSDKQTYYKLSLAGDTDDSVGKLARDLHYPDVNGDTALCEAASSAKCFFKLAKLGVPFPQNDFGEYVGYQTDHSLFPRATSAGPLTSRFMTEALEKSVKEKNIEILDHSLAVKILTDENGVCGLLCLKTDTGEWLKIDCAHVILCTGGPAHIYRDSVFPESQQGMSSLAFEAGAEGANLHCWQYGLASVSFRWNVSGSYQQSLPRYVSVDEKGVEREFLLDALDERDMLHRIFLKGYQWPFDPAKAEGSSFVDILVKRETDLGRRVYMDYRRNPTGFSPENLSEEAHSYLKNCGALQNSPIERLRAMNAPAIQLYRSHGIDLEKEMLEIKVCAQHHSGGIAVDANWQSCVPGLYVCGEAAGTFGKRRPGGSALNSTQVGSLRAAEHIARDSMRLPRESAAEVKLPILPAGDAEELLREMQADFSRHAAFMRNPEGMKKIMARCEEILGNSREAALDDPQLPARLRLKDLCITQINIISAMLLDLDAPGDGVIYTSNGNSHLRAARPLPDRDLWFERVWKKQLEKPMRLK